jgi:putative membrane protein
VSTTTPNAENALSDRRFMIANAVVSALALSLLAWLLLLRSGVPGSDSLSFMPAVNASLNATAAVLLLAGWRAIKQQNRSLHKRLMVSAFCASSLFLVGYVAYHYMHGDTKFMGQGAIRFAYFSILISHVLLSIAIVPMALAALYFAYQQRFQVHAKIARVLFPIWLYVSVTGVVIFFMLRGA